MSNYNQEKHLIFTQNLFNINSVFYLPTEVGEFFFKVSVYNELYPMKEPIFLFLKGQVLQKTKDFLHDLLH